MNLKKPKVLTFIHHYLPGYKAGGPIRSVANMTSTLTGLQFLIVTTDRDLKDTRAYDDVDLNKWCDNGNSKTFFVSHDPLNILKLFKFARIMRNTDHDVIYLNSFFDPIFTLLPLILRRLRLIPMRPVVLAPRGEFSLGAISLKAWKKIPYLYLMRTLGLCRDVLWQASSDYEAADIKRVLGATDASIRGGQDILIAPNITSVSVKNITRKLDGVLKIVFLSRISPKKNLAFLLATLAKVSVRVQCNVYGPIEDSAYWSSCKKQIETMPMNVAVNYNGSIPFHQVADVMANHDLFFLPTLGENFGHVILESLSAGTPVLISDQTPWRSDTRGACYALPLDDEASFVNVIERHATLGQKEREEISDSARILASTLADFESTKVANFRLFQAACILNR